MADGKYRVFPGSLHQGLWIRRSPFYYSLRCGWSLSPGPQLPNRYGHPPNLAHKYLCGLAFLPPALRIKVAVARAGDEYLNVLWKNPPEDVSRAAGMIIRRDHDGPVPFLGFGKLCQRIGLFPCAVSIHGKAQNLVFGHATLDQIVLHQFRDPRAGAQPSSARHNNRGLPFPKQFGGARGAVGIKIIVAQNNQGIGLAQRIFDDPGFRHEAEDGVAHEVQGEEESHEEQGNGQLD